MVGGKQENDRNYVIDTNQGFRSHYHFKLLISVMQLLLAVSTAFSSLVLSRQHGWHLLTFCPDADPPLVTTFLLNYLYHEKKSLFKK